MVEKIDEKYFSKYRGVGATTNYLDSIGAKAEAEAGKGVAGGGGSPKGESRLAAFCVVLGCVVSSFAVLRGGVRWGRVLCSFCSHVLS